MKTGNPESTTARHMPIPPLLLACCVILLVFACAGEQPATHAPVSCAELAHMFTQDQADRNADSDEPTAPKDRERRKRLFELLADGAVVTAEDKFRAAMILNHTSLKFCDGRIVSASVENYFLAHRLAMESFEAGNQDARVLVAQTIDRYSFYTTGQQMYGTHRVWNSELEKEFTAPVDPSVTDAERAVYGVAPLADLLARHPMQEKK